MAPSWGPGFAARSIYMTPCENRGYPTILDTQLYILPHIYIYIYRAVQQTGWVRMDVHLFRTFFTKLRIPEPRNGFWEL